jgi:hypothetical protein
MSQTRRLYPVMVISVLAMTLQSCATLGDLRSLIQPLSFEEAGDRQPQLRFLPPDRDLPRGGAALRMWTNVRNPNPFGLTLTHLQGELFLEGSRAATGDFPLGLPLRARENALVPIDLSISFADVPALADALRNALGGGGVAYNFDGRVTIDAGQLGQPTFGPSTLLRGEMRLLRW